MRREEEGGERRLECQVVCVHVVYPFILFEPRPLPPVKSSWVIKDPSFAINYIRVPLRPF